MDSGLIAERASSLRVLIVADVRLYREGLAGSLESRPQIQVVATSANRAEALCRFRELQPDVVVLDMATRESLDLIRDLRDEAVPPKILAFAVEEVSSEVLECAEAGASGYVTADATVDDVVAAIYRITRDELLCSPRIAATLFGRVAEHAHGSVFDRSCAKPMTTRERQVLECIRQGYSNKEIAQKFNIAEPTVKNHVHHLLEKLEVTTRAQAAARATLALDRRRPFGARRTG
jgi:two-component system, NarL family, nitrate/nitrite response regulator NarL